MRHPRQIRKNCGIHGRVIRAVNNDRGVTMVESIVSLLLAVLIVGIGVTGITSSLRLYQHIRQTFRAMELAEILADEFVAEVSACYGYVGGKSSELDRAMIYRYDPDAESELSGENSVESSALFLSQLPYRTEYDLIAFQGISGNNTRVTVGEDGRLWMYYPDSVDVQAFSLGGDAYYGLRVTEFKLEWAEDIRTGAVMLKVTLTLGSDAYASLHTVTRFIRSDNLHFPVGGMTENTVGLVVYR